MSALPVRMSSSVVFWSSFRVPLAFASEVKGWRLFHDRGRSGAVSVRPWRPRSLIARKGNPASTEPRTGAKDRPIDPTSGKNSPA